MLYSPFSDSMVDWLSRDRVTVAIAANIQFESGTVYVHSGTGTLVIGGYVYYGMGRMGSVDDASETSTTSPTQVKMTLSGLDMALFATMLNERCVGRNAEIYLVAMDDNGVVRVADLLFKGAYPAQGRPLAGRTPCSTPSVIFLKTGSVRSRIAIPMNRSRLLIPATAYSGMWRRCLNVRFTGAVKRCARIYL